MNRTASLTALEGELVAMIAAEGPVGVDRYMTLCLGHVRHGYYMRRDPLGRTGDFTTAPEISQIFGELIGIWSATAWQTMGEPSPFRLIELGPGRGTLMADLLRAVRVVPEFIEAARVALVETSPALRQTQGETLSRLGVAIDWHFRLEEVHPGPTLLLANEFFDVLGVQQFVRTATGWHERLVGIDDLGKLAFGLAPDPLPPAVLPDWAEAAAPGEVVEISPARDEAAQAIGARLKAMGGAGLIIDYGHVRSEPGDTLQAVRGHAFQGLLDRPGETDLTSHVDFEALGCALAKGGAAVHGPLTQGAFLSAMGLAERTEVLKRHADMNSRMDIDAATKRLAADTQMGHLFNVIAATHPDLPPPYPFKEPSA
ncbi:MAG TPA: SAM-dependent methyltransferase [Aestuariivirgaceae bacterium]|nr:SAM-dependent methyltransferase [Aestuariivirgaceae bacterium]